MDQDMIPILERVDDYDFYSPIWQYSNCHPKAPPPSPAPSSDQRLSMVNLATSSPIRDILPLVLTQRLSTASSETAPSMVHDKYDHSSDEDSIRFEYGEKLAHHSVATRPLGAIEWLAIDYDAESPPPHRPTLATESPYGFRFDGYDSSPSEQQVYIDGNCYGVASTTSEKTPVPGYPPTVHRSPPQHRTRNDDLSAPQPLRGTFSVFPCVSPNATASAGTTSRYREPAPVLQVERSVFEYDDDDDDDDNDTRFRRRLGSFSSHVRLPGRRGSVERGKTLKKRASSILHGILNCGLVRRT
ncbi:MAG: hypothetical protein M1839_008290 [Geoglossum umbratile]|nr:MAG: hypothetical protein M1839_008290 [Geoglossum umbratile]